MAFSVTSPPSAALPWVSLVNDDVITVPVCTPVYSDAAGGFKRAIADLTAKAVIIGLVVDPTIVPAASGNVLAIGVVTASTAQWDAVAGTSGGLAFGVVYYLSATVAGTLTTATTSGIKVVEGLSATQATIVVGGGASQPTTVSLVNASGAIATAGTPVFSSAAGAFGGGIATSFASAFAIGLVAADTPNGVSGSVQPLGVLTLTTAQWDAVAGTTGGLTFGQPYYLSAATAGSLTASAPAAVGQFVTLVGVALSTTQLRLLIQPPIGL